MNALTPKTLNVFNFVKENQADNLTLDSLAAALEADPRSVNGTLVALQKKKFIVREAAGTAMVNGKAKVISYIKVTPLGMQYDHDAAVAQDEADKAAEAERKAAAKAEREAAKAAKAE